jgi:hypothetical protein
MRDPVQHVQSHIYELKQTFSRWARAAGSCVLDLERLHHPVCVPATGFTKCCCMRQFERWPRRPTPALASLPAPRYIHHHRELNSVTAPMSWGYWSNVAPAAVSNYCTRMLLGRHFMCTAATEGPGDLRQEHAQYALAKLASYDVLLAMGRNDLNDPVFEHGLGWTNGTLRCAPGPGLPEAPAALALGLLHPMPADGPGPSWAPGALPQLQPARAPTPSAPPACPRSSVHQRTRANSNWMKQLNSASFLTPIRAMNQLDQLLFDQALLMLQLDASFYAAASQLASSWRPGQQGGGGGGGGFRHAAVIEQLMQQQGLPALLAEGQLPRPGRAACGLVQPRAPARE